MFKEQIGKNIETYEVFGRGACKDHNSLQNNCACEWEKVVLKC